MTILRLVEGWLAHVAGPSELVYNTIASSRLALYAKSDVRGVTGIAWILANPLHRQPLPFDNFGATSLSFWTMICVGVAWPDRQNQVDRSLTRLVLCGKFVASRSLVALSDG